MKKSRFLVLVLIIIIMAVLCGCGKLGEESAEKLVKDNLKVKDSYKKISYDVKEEAKVSKLVYRAKNLMGVELEGSVYFDLSEKNMVRVIADDSVPGVESVYQNAPNKLFNYIMAYYDFSEAVKKHGTRIDVYLRSVNSISKKGNLHDNFFAWKSCYSEADNYNERVKAVQAAWKALQDNSTPEALDRVKRSNEFKIYDGESCIEAREIDIHVSGDFMGWEGNFKFKE